MEKWILAFDIFFSIDIIFALVMGSLVGVLFGIIPGLGISQAMLITLPFTFTLEPYTAVVYFVSILVTASVGGSIPAILINAPGTPANVISTLDGFPFSQRGEALKAIYLSIICCFLGTIIGAILLVLSIPALRAIILSFQTPETFLLILFGISMISIVSKGNTFKGLAAGLIGILLSLIGRSYVFPIERFTGGSIFLYEGIPLAAVIIGAFALTAAVSMSGTKRISSDSQNKFLLESNKFGVLKSAIREIIKYKWVVLRGGIVGVIGGLIPAIGGGTSAFIHYFLSKQLSKNPELFGKGSPEGLIAAEVTNDAKDGGALMPTMAFGIPGCANTTVLLGILAIFGIPIGWHLLESSTEIVYLMVLTMPFAQIAASLIVFSMAKQVHKITNLNTYIIIPFIIAFAFIGTFVYRSNIWDLPIAALIACLAYGMMKFDFPVISMIIGYILGVRAERTFIMSLKISDGSLLVFLQSPICIALIIIIIGVFFLDAMLGMKRKKNEKTQVESVNNENYKKQIFNKSKPNVGSIIFMVFLIIVLSVFLLSSLSYSYDMRVFPIILSTISIVLLILLIISEFSPHLKNLINRLSGSLASLEEQANEKAEDKLPSKTVQKNNVIVLLSIISLSIAVIIFGYFILVPFLFVYILKHDKKMLKPALIFSIILSMVIFVMATFAVIPMWSGIIPEVIPNFLGGEQITPFF
ncbi:MAG: tripartite tricarboxylate transporter permease [Bacillota bacterium]|nr:tripartite tricarboxylate transporter permease [Bacillota bacterium]